MFQAFAHWHSSKQKALCEVKAEIGTGFAYFVPKIKQVFKGNSDKSQNQFAYFHSGIKRCKKLPMEWSMAMCLSKRFFLSVA